MYDNYAWERERKKLCDARNDDDDDNDNDDDLDGDDWNEIASGVGQKGRTRVRARTYKRLARDHELEKKPARWKLRRKSWRGLTVYIERKKKY